MKNSKPQKIILFFSLFLFLISQVYAQRGILMDDESQQVEYNPKADILGHLETLFRQYDSDFNDILDAQEFKKFYTQYEEQFDQTKLEQTIKAIDENQDNGIQLEQFYKLLDLEEKEYLETLKNMAQEMDKNGDGFLDKEEFHAFLKENQLEQDQFGIQEGEDEAEDFKIPISKVPELLASGGNQMVDELDMEEFFPSGSQINGSVFENYENSEIQEEPQDQVDL